MHPNGYLDDFTKAKEEWLAYRGNAEAKAARAKMDAAVEAFAAAELDSLSLEDIAKKWFKDYGSVDNVSDEHEFEHKVAHVLHEHALHVDPSMHSFKTNKYDWWDEHVCTCGYFYSNLVFDRF